MLTLTVDSLGNTDEQTSITLTLAFYSGLILILLLCLYPLVRRLMLLQESARAFGAGDLNARLQPSRWSYIGSLEVAFNQMAEQVQSLLADNRLLSRAVSHDLKTPIARLRFGFEMLEESQSAEQSARYLARIGQDLAAMEALINRLLDYAKLEEGHIKLDMQPLNLNHLVAPCGINWSAADTSYSVNCAPRQPGSRGQTLPQHADQQPAKQRGALRPAAHLPANGAAQTDGGIEHQRRRPGYSAAGALSRVKTLCARQRQRPHGHGMGLAIAERIASWHKANISLDTDERLGGLCVRIIFNACAPTQTAH